MRLTLWLLGQLVALLRQPAQYERVLRHHHLCKAVKIRLVKQKALLREEQPRKCQKCLLLWAKRVPSTISKLSALIKLNWQRYSRNSMSWISLSQKESANWSKSTKSMTSESLTSNESRSIRCRTKMKPKRKREQTDLRRPSMHLAMTNRGLLPAELGQPLIQQHKPRRLRNSRRTRQREWLIRKNEKD